jgi:hypothetical protein
VDTLHEIRSRWGDANWQYRERRLLNGKIGSVGIETADGLPIASTIFAEEAGVFQLLAQAPQDIIALLDYIGNIERPAGDDWTCDQCGCVFSPGHGDDVECPQCGAYLGPYEEQK